jgi:Spy/CpxP family protein refolding chaperone
MRGRPWRGDRPCWRASDLDLTLDQVKRLDLIYQAYFQETQLPRTELFAKRLELREFLTNPNIRIESIRSKYLEINEIQSKLEEKIIEYVIKVRNLLTQEQLKNWCPEQEFPLFQRMMHGPRPMGIMPPRRPPFPEGPRKE